MVIFHPNVGVCPTMIFLGTWKLVVGLLKRSSPPKKKTVLPADSPFLVDRPMGKQHTSSANLGLEETTVVFHGFNGSDLPIYPSFCGTGPLYLKFFIQFWNMVFSNQPGYRVTPPIRVLQLGASKEL